MRFPDFNIGYVAAVPWALPSDREEGLGTSFWGQFQLPKLPNRLNQTESDENSAQFMAAHDMKEPARRYYIILGYTR